MSAHASRRRAAREPRSPSAWAGDPPQRRAARAQLSEEECDEAVEVMLRFTLSLLASPEPRRDDAQLRGFLRRRLLPALGLTAADREADPPLRSH